MTVLINICNVLEPIDLCWSSSKVIGGNELNTFPQALTWIAESGETIKWLGSIRVFQCTLQLRSVCALCNVHLFLVLFSFYTCLIPEYIIDANF